MLLAQIKHTSFWWVLFVVEGVVDAPKESRLDSFRSPSRRRLVRARARPKPAFNLTAAPEARERRWQRRLGERRLEERRLGERRHRARHRRRRRRSPATTAAGRSSPRRLTIYANTDDTLYSMDPDTKAVTLIGPFAGLLDASAEDRAVTDVAKLNAEGDIYANSEQYIYKVVLPASGTGTVQLTNAQKINAGTTVYMYALAFAPPGLLGTGRRDAHRRRRQWRRVWSIPIPRPATRRRTSATSAPTRASPATSSRALRRHRPLYLDNGAATGLATIRSCAPPPAKYPNDPPTCSTTERLLAGIDITELTNAYTSGTPSKSRSNGGIYGGSSTASGPGTGASASCTGSARGKGDVYAFRSRDGGEGRRHPGGRPRARLDQHDHGSRHARPHDVRFHDEGLVRRRRHDTKVTVTVKPPPPPPVRSQ